MTKTTKEQSILEFMAQELMTITDPELFHPIPPVKEHHTVIEGEVTLEEKKLFGMMIVHEKAYKQLQLEHEFSRPEECETISAQFMAEQELYCLYRQALYTSIKKRIPQAAHQSAHGLAIGIRKGWTIVCMERQSDNPLLGFLRSLSE